MKIEKGKRYRVVSSYDAFFKVGEIVVALENDDTPWCVKESDYDENMKCVYCYDEDICGLFCNDELEKIEGEDYAEDASEELLKYREIGTLDECRVAVEKQKAKKPYRKRFIITPEAKPICCCRNCGYPTGDAHYAFCANCGQKLDWGSE